MLMDDNGSRVDQAAGLRRLMARPALRIVAVIDGAGDVLTQQLAARLGEQGAPSLMIGAGESAVHQYPGGAVLDAQARALARADTADAMAWLCSADVRFVLARAAMPQARGPVGFAAEVMLVVDAEPQAAIAENLTATYGVLKQLHARDAAPRCHILVRGGPPAAAPALFSRLESVASRFLGMGLGFAGHVPAAGDRGAVAHNAQAEVARRLVALAPY